jgi:hypothetical protein
VVLEKARTPQRGDASEAREVVLGQEQQPSRPSSHPNQYYSAYSGQRRIGFVVSRGKQHEAFDRHDKSIGVYPSVKTAAAAVSEAARAFHDEGE